MINTRIFYYARITTGRYTDGNDCLWVSEKAHNAGITLNTYDIEKAKIFSTDEVVNMSHLSKIDGIEFHPVHEIDKLIQFHAPVKKFRRSTTLKDGDLCYLMSKRDTCGTNASFWAWNHKGYVSDIRNAQIFKYNDQMAMANREFEYFIPIEKVKKQVNKRIDIQDLRAGRTVSHVLATDYFKETV